MDLIVGNSIVKYWGEETGRSMRVFCLPGATLDRILLKAIAEHQESDRYVYLQSGIPDMHLKGEHSGIRPERFSLYKSTLAKAHQYLPNAIILMVYPPLNAPQGVCEKYHETNKFIMQLNPVKTPNTISRIFHRDHNQNWRVECARLSDGIHLTRAEVSRMVRRLYDDVDTSKQVSVKTSEKPEIRRETRKRSRSPENSKQDKKIMVTIEGSGSSSDKIEQLLIKKKRKLADLKEEFARREIAIEEECVEEIRKVLKVPSTTVTQSDKPAEEECLQIEEDNTDEEFMILDEWQPGTRDIRTDVPRRVHLC